MSGATTLSGFRAAAPQRFRVVSIIALGNFGIQDSLYG
jgi:hypothetical protein